VPYIKPEERERLTPPEGMKAGIPKTSGELNYLISMRIKHEIEREGRPPEKGSTLKYNGPYELYNDIISDLDDAKLATKMGIRPEPGFAGDVIDCVAKFVLQTDNLDEVVPPTSQGELEAIAKRQASAAGAIEAAKLEFHRRVVAVYEDDKRRLNGDVY
jgi:hypothetical protein